MNGTQVIQTVNMSSCSPPADAGGSGDDGGSSGDDAGGGAGDDAGGAASGDDGGAMDLGNCGDPAFGTTLYGTSGADDDCKYDVKWTSTPLCQGPSVYFTVTVMYRSSTGTAMPVRNANPRPDVVLDCTHTIPNSPKPADPSPEISPGVYTVGPVVFDKPGKWNVRFHFFETCVDQPDSPHGHAAFYVQVP